MKNLMIPSWERSSTLKSHQLRRPSEPTLFHYTSANALIGIGQTRELWATHIQFLNDHQEGKVIETMLEPVLHSMRRERQLTEDEEELLAEIRMNTQGTVRLNYVISLTTHGDQLAQWRGYCPPEGGYVIGFPSSWLADQAAKQDFQLVECIYNRDLQAQILIELLDSFLSEFRQRKANGENGPALIRAVARDFGEQVSEFSAVMKHHTFREEGEWRLISRRLTTTDNRIRFRPGKSTVIPYITLKLTDDANRQWPQGMEVIIGPRRSLYGRADWLSVQMVANNLFGCGPQASEVPFMPGRW